MLTDKIGISFVIENTEAERVKVDKALEFNSKAFAAVYLYFICGFYSLFYCYCFFNKEIWSF